jgi:hypothetical protein
VIRARPPSERVYSIYAIGVEVFSFQKLGKAFLGADSRKLKMRRLPPTLEPTPPSTTIYRSIFLVKRIPLFVH